MEKRKHPPGCQRQRPTRTQTGEEVRQRQRGQGRSVQGFPFSRHDLPDTETATTARGCGHGAEPCLSLLLPLPTSPSRAPERSRAQEGAGAGGSGAAGGAVRGGWDEPGSSCRVFPSLCGHPGFSSVLTSIRALHEMFPPAKSRREHREPSPSRSAPAWPSPLRSPRHSPVPGQHPREVVGPPSLGMPPKRADVALHQLLQWPWGYPVILGVFSSLIP